jgi:hypothetical protein
MDWKSILITWAHSNSTILWQCIVVYSHLLRGRALRRAHNKADRKDVYFDCMKQKS